MKIRPDNRSLHPSFRLPRYLLAAAAILLLAGCKPDLTSEGGLKIGDQQVPWDGQVVLTAADAIAPGSGGRCAFDIEYTMANAGDGPAIPSFWNRLRAGAELVTEQSGLALAPDRPGHGVVLDFEALETHRHTT